MSKASKFLVVSLPTSISASNSTDEALGAIRSTVSSDNGSVTQFAIPIFKIGTLDALVQQADDLAKLDTACEGVVNKIADTLRSLLDGDESKIAQQKTINDKPVDQYLRSFSWNKIKYRADRPIADIIDSLQKELVGLDNDVKAKLNQYSQIKTNLTASQRKQTGNLSTKSLASVVPPEVFKRTQDSEYLDTHLIAVPKQQVKEFYKTYEGLASSPGIVPRSAQEIASDDEFTLFAVTGFKKTSTEFVHKCREQRWTPRDFKYKEGGREEEAREVDKLTQDERKVWGESLRMSRTGYSESAMIWVHVLALRVFVETVLRYGLPPEFVCGLIQAPSSKQANKAKANLDSKYSYLGGNAFGRDSKGKIVKDEVSEFQGAGVDATADYSAYVYYEFDIV